MEGYLTDVTLMSLGIIVICLMIISYKFGRVVNNDFILDYYGLSPKQLEQVYNDKYENAKRTSNENESLILCAECLLIRKIMNRQLNSNIGSKLLIERNPL